MIKPGSGITFSEKLFKYKPFHKVTRVLPGTGREAVHLTNSLATFACPEHLAGAEFKRQGGTRLFGGGILKAITVRLCHGYWSLLSVRLSVKKSRICSEA